MRQTLQSRLAITMGDPGGVGPEIVLRALDDPWVRENTTAVVVGEPVVLEEARALAGTSLPLVRITDAVQARAGQVNILSVVSAGSENVSYPRGVPSAQAGGLIQRCIRNGVTLCLSKVCDALVTAPIAKESLSRAGLPWPGHTEFLAHLTETEEYAMMLVGGPLRVLLVTIHTPLRAVSSQITRERVHSTIHLARRAGRMLGIAEPRIAVAGLNPHGGEGGMFGHEEIEAIGPAVERAAVDGIRVSGPFPPDTVFHRAYHGEIDLVVCMYHDQGLIPLKMIAFETGVNVTVGLPFVRTSPDHGTAFDIAWSGNASPTSMVEAIRLAAACRPA